VRPECDDRDNPRVALRCTLKLSKEYPTAAEACVELRCSAVSLTRRNEF
jgi:hypothetical protein